MRVRAAPGQAQFPRVRAALRVPVMGSAYDRRQQASDRNTITFGVVPKSVRIQKNDFNTADECTIVFGPDQAGIDPRLLGNAIVEVYIADAGATGTWQPRPADVAFLGIAVSARRTLDEGAPSMTLRALDYTTLFLAQKPLGDLGVPRYLHTLTEAWAKICDNVGLYDFEQRRVVSTVEMLRDSRELRGVDDLVIGDFVLERL